MNQKKLLELSSLSLIYMFMETYKIDSQYLVNKVEEKNLNERNLLVSFNDEQIQKVWEIWQLSSIATLSLISIKMDSYRNQTIFNKIKIFLIKWGLKHGLIRHIKK